MPKFRFEFRLAQEPWIYFILCLALLITPITWLFAWCISVAVHETGHLLMTKVLSVPVYGLTLGINGARIHTAPMEEWQELLCALAGPMAGLLLVCLGRWIPLIALFSFVHTAWNLLPLGNRDGARVLRSLWGLIRKIPCKPGRERVQ